MTYLVILLSILYVCVQQHNKQHVNLRAGTLEVGGVKLMNGWTRFDNRGDISLCHSAT